VLAGSQNGSKATLSEGQYFLARNRSVASGSKGSIRNGEAPSGWDWSRSIAKANGMLMSESRRNVWNVLALALQAICSSPLAPDAATAHIISYNCHGTLVFISRTQNILLFGLIPALVVAGVCGRAARKRAGPPTANGDE
jgi:hypothetical protein